VQLDSVEGLVDDGRLWRRRWTMHCPSCAVIDKSQPIDNLLTTDDDRPRWKKGRTLAWCRHAAAADAVRIGGRAPPQKSSSTVIVLG